MKTLPHTDTELMAFTRGNYLLTLISFLCEKTILPFFCETKRIPFSIDLKAEGGL